MASEGGNKLKWKRNQTPSKPYDRNTSLLGKLKHSVKDLLIPSWLSGSPSQTKTVEPRDDKQISPLVGNNFSVSSATSNSDEFSKPGKRLESSDIGTTQDLDDSGVITFPKLNRQEEPKKFGSNYKSSASSEPPPLNVNIATFYRQGDNYFNNSEKLTPGSHKETTRKSVELNESNHALSTTVSRLDESDITATDSTVRPIMVLTGASSRATSSDSAKRQRLWSPDSLRQGRPFTVQAVEKPTFNSFLFNSPNKSNASLLGSIMHESSFYSGKTRYGGAAAERKNTSISSPYRSSLPLRKQVKASALNKSLNATTSATAQRILETLDRMSTPLGDAKKIPQVDANDSVLSFTPSSYRRTSLLNTSRSTTRPLQIPNIGAPKSQHQSISQAVIAKNRNKHSIVDKRLSSSQETGGGIESSSFDSSQLPASMEPSLNKISTTVAMKNLPSAGKMKAKKFSQHLSSKGSDDDAVVEVPNLRTDFTLPITSICPISLQSVCVKSHSVASSSIPTDKTQLKFTFSTPIEEKRKPSSNLIVDSVDKGFKFSSPIKASNVKINAAGAEEGSKFSLEPAVGASSVVSASFSSTIPVWGSTAPRPKVADIGGTSSSFKTYNKFPDSDSSAASDMASTGFSLAPASSLKTGSVMDILGKGNNFPSTSTSSMTGVSTSQGDLMLKFKKPAGSWECDSCMLMNKPEANKCIACETSKPGSKQGSLTAATAAPIAGSDLMSQFKKPSGSWECQTCLINNKSDVSKCIACETPRAGSSIQSPAATNSLSALFKKPPGNWECDTCMIQNAASALRCVACDSPKPGLQAAGVVAKSAEPKSSALTVSPTAGFVFNVPTTTATTVGSGGFKFGNTSTISDSTSTGCQFGQTVASNSSEVTKSGLSSAPLASRFKFGNSNLSAVPQTGGFKFGDSSTQGGSSNALTDSSAANPGGGFKFGSSSSATTTVQKDFQFGIATKNIVSSESAASEKHSSSNGQINLNSSSGGFQLGAGTVTFTAGSTAQQILAGTDSTLKTPHVNFNPSASSVAPSFSMTTSQTLVKDAASKPVNNLFQFGASLSSSQSNSVGLGMNSLTSDKPLTNGGFGTGFNATPAQPKSSDGVSPLGSGLNATASTFSGFGQLANTSNPTSSVSFAHQNKRSVDSSDPDAPSGKKVHFGSTTNEVATNGLFSFGASKSSSFGTNASNCANPSGGFLFGGSTPAAQPTQLNPQGSGFQFSVGSGPTTTFSFNAGSDTAKAAAEVKNTVFPPPATFNFGATAQQSGGPFLFGAKNNETQPSSASFGFSATNTTHPPAVGTFNIGAGGEPRKKIKAVRKMKK